MLEFEEQLWHQGLRWIAGVDEVGRGPLAGPVVAAAVVLAPDFARREVDGLLCGLTDSKALPATARERFWGILTRSPHVEWAIGMADVAEIDALNITQATRVAMIRALRALRILPEYVLVDGLPIQGLPVPSTALVRGDSRSLSVAAASVVAKVTRDRLMRDLDRADGRYGFARNKGYGTSSHLQALLEYGPSPAHRHSFRPVQEAAAIRARVLQNHE